MSVSPHGDSSGSVPGPVCSRGLPGAAWRRVVSVPIWEGAASCTAAVRRSPGEGWAGGGPCTAQGGSAHIGVWEHWQDGEVLCRLEEL